MRVLFVNAFHYLRGGVERTYFDETRWLEAAGHEVAHFAIHHPANVPSPMAPHFAPAAEYGEGAPLGRQLRRLPDALWSAPAARAMRGLLGTFRPDVAHVHAPSRYLTPSVLRPLEDAGVPIVMTLHDFKPWCANRVLFAHGAPCERCRGGAHWHAVATGCVQGSRLKSAIGSIEAYLHDAIGAYRAVRTWIAPSRFALEKAASLGAPRERLRLLRHGVERQAPADAGAREAEGEAMPKVIGIDVPEQPYVLFAGRLSAEKGVALLPRVAAAIGETPLLVAGEGPSYAAMERAAQAQRNIRLVGHLPGGVLAAALERAAVVIVPSLFYETYCYAVAEAQLEGRVVVASRIGAIPELIEDGVTGLLAEPGDAESLADAVVRALHDPGARAWGEAGRQRILEDGRPAAHTAGLTEIYGRAIRNG